MTRMENKAIAKHYYAAIDEALKQLEAAARIILRRHSTLNEFVMAMGGWFFTLKLGAIDRHGIVVTPSNDIIHSSDDDPRFRRVAHIIDEWDNYLKLTGVPMRFTATSKITRTW